MKVAFHSDAFASGARYGLGRYSHELWGALRRTDPGLQLEAFGLRGSRTTAPALRPQWDGRLYIALWATLGAPRIERWMARPDLVHSVELDYPVATSRPWIVTAHDLGPLTHPQYFSGSRPWLRRRALHQAVRRAAFIVAVSSETAHAIEREAQASLGERLRIVPEGVNAEYFACRDASCEIPQNLPPRGTPYFLWTGSLNPRKNLRTVLRAFELAARDMPHHLVLAGGLGWDSAATLLALEQSPVRGRIHRPGFVTDAQLRALYQGADGFLYVSLMEGFGLPILEAMASGCPVITSNLSSMPEVAGDAAMLVDPLSEEEVAHAVLRLASSATLRAELILRGRARAAQFTWEKCAATMRQLYDAAR